MALTLLLVVGIANSVTDPLIVMRPTLPAICSVNHNLPAGQGLATIVIDP
jgi:hypothetical protein